MTATDHHGKTLKSGDRVQYIGPGCDQLTDPVRVIKLVYLLHKLPLLQFETGEHALAYQVILLDTPQVQEVQGCTCDFTGTNWMRGCTCGWFQKEQETAHAHAS